MIKTEHILEFDKIKETWKTFALTESARTEIEKTEPMMDAYCGNRWLSYTGTA